MNVTFYDSDFGATVSDEKGNAVDYIKLHNLLQPITATFDNTLYEKTRFGWKRCGRGAVSMSFYDWYEEFSNAVYEGHYVNKEKQQ